MRITPAAFKELCSRNQNLHAELSSDGKLTYMAPTGGNSGWRNSKLTHQIEAWTELADGIAFDSSTVFSLPNGAMRSPDAAWVRSDRWEALTAEEQDGFPPLCPEFVVELRSMTDRLASRQAKMEEFIANGAVLGFLIDPKDGCAHIYRPGTTPQSLIRPDALSGDPELPGLVIDLTRIW
ncbi:MAG: Uma2 family endonuclease [Verrucomicrobia bacterium]|nr:Uma2 family endonuclease [Verrucomicrobiota bacterium]